jgi:hypothetical protein
MPLQPNRTARRVQKSTGRQCMWKRSLVMDHVELSGSSATRNDGSLG